MLVSIVSMLVSIVCMLVSIVGMLAIKLCILVSIVDMLVYVCLLGYPVMVVSTGYGN